MLNEEPLRCELSVIANRNFVIERHLHNLPLLCVFTSVLHEIFESVKVMKSSIHDSAFRHYFLVRSHEEEDDEDELQVHKHHFKQGHSHKGKFGELLSLDPRLLLVDLYLLILLLLEPEVVLILSQLISVHLNEVLLLLLVLLNINRILLLLHCFLSFYLFF